MAMDRFGRCREDDGLLLECRCGAVAIGAQLLFLGEDQDDATGCWDQDDVVLCSRHQPAVRTRPYDSPSASRWTNAATSLRPARWRVRGVSARSDRNARASGF